MGSQPQHTPFFRGHSFVAESGGIEPLALRPHPASNRRPNLSGTLSISSAHSFLCAGGRIGRIPHFFARASITPRWSKCESTAFIWFLHPIQPPAILRRPSPARRRIPIGPHRGSHIMGPGPPTDRQSPLDSKRVRVDRHPAGQHPTPTVCALTQLPCVFNEKMAPRPGTAPGILRLTVGSVRLLGREEK